MQQSLSALLVSIPAYAIFASAPIAAQNYVKIGDGCEGVAGIPSVTPLGDPVLGETFSVELGNVDNMGIAAGLSGLSNSQWLGLALPADLGLALGMYGLDPMGMQMDPCILYTDVRRVASLTIAGGTATWDLNMPPLSLEWIGRKFYQQAFVIDSNVSGLPAVLSDAYEGTMVEPPIDLSLEHPMGIVVDGTRALVADANRAAVFAIDLATGDRSVFSGLLTGNGPALRRPQGIAIDSANGRLLVCDLWDIQLGGLPAVVGIDLTTGDRSIVSDANTGTGPDWTNIYDIAIDGSRAIVIDLTLKGLWAMDLSTGDRQVVSSNSMGSGPEIVGASPYAMSVVGSTAYITSQMGVPMQSSTNALLAVDLSTGNRTDLSSRVTGSGPIVLSLTGVQPEGSRILVACSSLDLIYSIDPSTGARTVFSGLANSTSGTAQVGTGPGFGVANHLALDGNRILVTDLQLDAVLTVDLATGDRAILSDNN